MLSKLKFTKQAVAQLRFITLNPAVRSTLQLSPDQSGKVGEVLITSKHGPDLIHDSILNKGTGFPLEERERMGIRGLVPPRIPESKEKALKNQVQRVMSRYHKLTTPLAKYSYVSSLQDRNELLFYRCLIDHLDDMAPIVYTPTVGIACQSFSNIFRRSRGMYFSALDKGHMHAMTYNWPINDVQIIVVTDGSRILGLGDLGVNGMGIPIGKLSLYTAAAGIHPSRCLPVLIDVGTNNESLLRDPMYLGLPQRRISGDSYNEIIDEFLSAVKGRWPRVLVQFEDFSNENAMKILQKYRNKTLCFNDDIQGTGCVALAGVLSALRLQGYSNPLEALKDQRIVVLGAGSAGLGVSGAIHYAMTQNGMSEEEAYSKFWILDQEGLLGRNRPPNSPAQKPFVRSDYNDKMSLFETVKEVKPTIIFGLTGCGGLFTEQIIRQMSSTVKRPIIFPLSNPTDKAECTAQQAYEWSNGTAIFASGSPFDPVTLNDNKYYPGQANNMYTFPGIGLGALSVHAKMITDSMLNAAAIELANSVTEQELGAGKIFPDIMNIRKVSENIAVAVGMEAFKENLATVPMPEDGEAGLRQIVKDNMWDPEYGSLIRIDP